MYLLGWLWGKFRKYTIILIRPETADCFMIVFVSVALITITAISSLFLLSYFYWTGACICIWVLPMDAVLIILRVFDWIKYWKYVYQGNLFARSNFFLSPHCYTSAKGMPPTKEKLASRENYPSPRPSATSSSGKTERRWISTFRKVTESASCMK
jgi:hypothetical protein